MKLPSTLHGWVIAMKAISKVLFATFLFICMTSLSYSMEVSIVKWKIGNVLFLKGEIKRGDHKKILKNIQKIKKFPHGSVVVLLNSNGGSVYEAFKIADIFIKYKVHTVIPYNAKCASACASILFLAGKFRTLQEGGLLGQHSCSLEGKPDPLCNKLISRYAIERGVSYGSVAAFVTYVQPKDIIWFDKYDADCWGLTKYPFEKESGFVNKPEPCVAKIITGRYPQAQGAWRVDFYKNGYKAFIRPVADHIRELQANIHCNELKKGKLFLTLDIFGEYKEIKKHVIAIIMKIDNNVYTIKNFKIFQGRENLLLSHIQVEISSSKIIKYFLSRSKWLEIIVKIKPPYKDMKIKVPTYTSRKALLFAANNCINKF